MRKTTFASAPNEVAELLKEAMERGQLVVLRTAPPHDDAKTSLLLALNLLFGLTLAESRALMALMGHPHISREALHAAMSRDGNPVSKIKIVDVIVCRMREKLAAHDIKISTVHGQGYRLADGACDKIHKLLAEVEPMNVHAPP